MSIEETRAFWAAKKAELVALPGDIECCACEHTLDEHENAREVPDESDWFSEYPEQECSECSCTWFEQPSPMKGNTTMAASTTVTTPTNGSASTTPTAPAVTTVPTTRSGLSRTDWDSIKATASTVSNYDPDNSVIRGLTTIQILGAIATNLDGGNVADAQGLVTALMRREAYNAFIGIERKKLMTQRAAQTPSA